jgi:hypothetical protein
MGQTQYTNLWVPEGHTHVTRTKPLPIEEVLKILCMMKFVILCTYLGPAIFLLYHSDRFNTSETVFHWCYVNDLHTTYVVVCWVTTVGIRANSLTLGLKPFNRRPVGLVVTLGSYLT